MSTERKIFIAAAFLCLVALCAALVIAAVIVSGPAPARAIVPIFVAAVAWYLGSSITEALKNNRQD